MPADTPNPLREKLAALIAESGLSQRSLAQATGVHQSTISHLITGARGTEPSAEVIARLLRALGQSPTAVGRILYECYPEEKSG